MPPRATVLLVDPSLFTAPYDGALTRGLLESGVEPRWATRPLRPGERGEIDARYVDDFFYRRIETARGLPPRLRAALKGVAHVIGLSRLVIGALRDRPSVVHFQWTVLPPVDALAIWLLRAIAPVVLTVHDTLPFNGERISFWQNFGFDWPLALADRVIVHTRAGERTLIERGVDPRKIQVIPHGPLSLGITPPKVARKDSRYTFVVFGEIKPYKGVDVLLEAVGLLPLELRRQARLVIAGRARMDLAPLYERREELGLESMVELREGRLSEPEMAELFAEADCFVMPYRQIDASGVYYLIKSLGKWVIASRIGIFAEDMRENEQGRLVTAGDPSALAVALAHAIAERPEPSKVTAGAAWEQIADATCELYREACNERSRRVPVVERRPQT
jgi:glycosyltransferase involved in cell wall biosynthesis